MRESQLDSLFGFETVTLSECSAEDFGDRDYILDRLYNELSSQFNTRKQILLKTMYTFIFQDKKIIDDTFGFNMFGTTSYHEVWEKMCSEIFDNKINSPIDDIKFSKPINIPHSSSTKLIDIIEKPLWERNQYKHRATDSLIPDIISIQHIEEKDSFLIFDAKYYNLTIDDKLSGNPGVGDVTKQYLYQLAFKDLVKSQGIENIKNCFLFPTEENDIINYGFAKMKMLSVNYELEDIQIRLLPAKMVNKLYLENKKIDIDLLQLD